jgi:hypothetical protein
VVVGSLRWGCKVKELLGLRERRTRQDGGPKSPKNVRVGLKAPPKRMEMMTRSNLLL